MRRYRLWRVRRQYRKIRDQVARDWYRRYCLDPEMQAWLDKLGKAMTRATGWGVTVRVDESVYRGLVARCDSDDPPVHPGMRIPYDRRVKMDDRQLDLDRE